MSSRNRRIKPIEANLRKEITVLEDSIHDLHEDNSNLTRIVEEQRDLIHTQNKKLTAEIKDLKTDYDGLCHNLKNQSDLIFDLRKRLAIQEELAQTMQQKSNYNYRTFGMAIAELQSFIDKAKQTWLGKFIFK